MRLYRYINRIAVSEILDRCGSFWFFNPLIDSLHGNAKLFFLIFHIYYEDMEPIPLCYVHE